MTAKFNRLSTYSYLCRNKAICLASVEKSRKLWRVDPGCETSTQLLSHSLSHSLSLSHSGQGKKTKWKSSWIKVNHLTATVNGETRLDLEKNNLIYCQRVEWWETKTKAKAPSARILTFPRPMMYVWKLSNGLLSLLVELHIWQS